MADPRLPADAFRALLHAAVTCLDPVLQPHLARYRVEPVPVPCARYNDEVVEPLWAVARAGACWLCWDDEEREWGTGVADAQGVLRGWGTWGRLDAALENFPE